MAWLTPRLNQVVFGGGSFFFAADSMRYWGRFLDRVKSELHFAAGVSFGPFKHREDEAACAEFVRRLRFVGLRDAQSYARVRALCPGVDAELTFDLAPLLSLAADEETLPGKPARRGLGIALRHYERYVGGDVECERRRLSRIAEAITLAARRGAVEELVLIDFNGNAALGDHAVHEELIALLGEKIPVRHLAYTDNAYQVLCTIKGLRGIIAMRMHATVFAYCAQTPCVTLAYHEKCLGWAQQVGHPETLLHDAAHIDPPRLAASIEALNSQPPLLAALPLEEAIARALRNWSWHSRRD